MNNDDKMYIEYLKSQGFSEEEAIAENERQKATTSSESVPLEEGSDFSKSAETGLKGASKVLGYLQNLTTSPLAALATEIYTGKDVFKPKEWWSSLSSLEPYQTPSQSLKMGGINIPQGFKLSDTGLVEKESPWNIGLSDALIDTGLDPAFWLSGGLSAAAKQGLRTGAGLYAKQAAKSLPSKIVGSVTKPVGEAISIATKTPRKLTTKSLQAAGLVSKELGKEGTLTGAGKVAHGIINMPEVLIGKFGKKSYEKAFAPLNWEAQSSSVKPSDILYDIGVSGGYKDVPDILEQVSKGSGREMSKAYEYADALGAEVPVKKAVSEGKRIGKELIDSSNEESIRAGENILERIKLLKEKYGKTMPPSKAWEEGKRLRDISYANKSSEKARKRLSSAAEMKLEEGLKRGAEEAMQSPNVLAQDPGLFIDFTRDKNLYKASSGDVINKAIDKAKSQYVSPKELMTLTGGDILGGVGTYALGTSLGYSPWISALAAPVLRKSAQILSTPPVLTGVGNISKRVSGSPALQLLRTPVRQSTWSLMNQPEGEEQ